MTRFSPARSGIGSFAIALSLSLAACQATIDGTTSRLTPSTAKKAATPATSPKKATVGATLQGVVLAPATLIGNDSAGLIGNDSAGLIGNDSAGLSGNDTAGLQAGNKASESQGGALIGNDGASYALLALGQSPCVRVKVTLADASGTAIPGAPEVETDVMGRFSFPGKLPTNFGYHLMATVTTTKGAVAKLHAMGVPGDASITIDVPGTLVTHAALTGRKGALGAMSNATFEKARAAAGAQLALTDLPDLGDEAAVKAFAKTLMGRVSALEDAVGKLTGDMDKVKAEVSALEAAMATLTKEAERLTAPPTIAIAQEIPTGAAPRAITFDAAGTLWVACYKDASVQRIAPDGKTTTIDVGESPLGLAIGPDGDVWATAFAAGKVTRIAPDGTVKGQFPCGAAPFGVVVAPDGHVFVTNYKVKTVTELDNAGAIVGTYAACPRAFGIARDADGGIWVTSNAAHGVVKLGATPGQAATGFSTDRAPSMIAFDAKGDAWVTSTGSDRLTKLSATGAPLGSFDTGGDEPWGLAIAATGEIWVTNTSGATKVDQNEAMRPQSIARFDAGGKRTGLWFLPDSPQGVALDGQGRPWVALREANKVVRLNP